MSLFLTLLTLLMPDSATIQTETVVKNIQQLVEDKPLDLYPVPGPAGIHMTLGVVRLPC